MRDDPRKAVALSIFDGQKLNISTLFKQILPDQPCVLCGSMSDAGLWCAACDASLPYYTEPRCPRCALPAPDGEICGQCLTHPHALSATLAAFSYRFPIDRLILAMKYQEQMALSALFAEKLALNINDLPDVIIPMPLHPAKLKSRGYNQALLIAKPLGKLLTIEVQSHACRRLRDTPSQTSLPWDEREKNVRGAFVCDADLSGKHVALIDDVLTTGASLKELALSIKGASRVSAWVIARTLPGHSK